MSHLLRMKDIKARNFGRNYKPRGTRKVEHEAMIDNGVIVAVSVIALVCWAIYVAVSLIELASLV